MFRQHEACAWLALHEACKAPGPAHGLRPRGEVGALEQEPGRQGQAEVAGVGPRVPHSGRGRDRVAAAAGLVDGWDHTCRRKAQRRDDDHPAVRPPVRRAAPAARHQPDAGAACAPRLRRPGDALRGAAEPPRRRPWPRHGPERTFGGKAKPLSPSDNGWGRGARYDGARYRIRTCGLRLRRPTLYPTELIAQVWQPLAALTYAVAPLARQAGRSAATSRRRSCPGRSRSR